MGTHKKDPANWKIKRNRNGREHIDACSEGYYQTTYLLMQVHHILPIESLGNATIEEKLTPKQADFIKKCLMITDWNINVAPNVVGLPLKRVYWQQSLPGTPKGWEIWPCHQVDHNPKYNTEVCEDLQEKIWQNAEELAEDCKVDPETLKNALEARSKFWLGELTARAKRGGPSDKSGVTYCWANREKLPDTWYRPFSMARTPSPRQPPKDWAQLSKNLEKYVKAIFEAL